MLSFVDQGSGIAYSAEGCTFEFSVAGDTATLSNGPITCNETASDGSLIVITVTTYTLNVSNGNELTASAMATAPSPLGPCDATIMIMASR